MDATKTKGMRWMSIAAFLLCIGACTGPGNDPVSGNVTGKDKPGVKPTKGVVGVLVDQGGKPLKGTAVKAIAGEADGSLGKITASMRPMGGAASSLAASDSAVTDSSGQYVFEDLVSGTYNIQGDYSDGKLVVLIKGVKYDGNGALLEVTTDTLRLPGKISGRAVFNDDDNGGIICYVPGTSYLALSDDSGSFTLSNIPQGSYSIAYRKDGWRTAKDTAVMVKSGMDTRLSVKVLKADPGYPPPAPSGLVVAYDTLTGKATLSWGRVSVSDLAGYVIYRNSPSSTEPLKLSTALVKDTFFVDPLFPDPADTQDKEYTYRLKAQDVEANLSTVFSKPTTLKAGSPANVRTAFAWQRTGGKGDSASIGDSVTVTVSYSNPTRRIRKVALYVDAKIVPAGFRQDSAKSGKDSIKVTGVNPAKRTIYAEATDEAGGVWWDSVTVRYVLDVPRVDAGTDTLLAIHSKAYFNGSAAQAFGSIAMWKWDFNGDGTFDDSSSVSASVTHVYTHAGLFRARLAARDDDGNESFDDRNVEVMNKAPKVTAIRADTLVTILDPVAFHGAGSDSEGTIREYAWDFDGNGSYDTVAAGPISTSRTFAKAGVYQASLRVTDDDGMTAVRNAVITVILDAPVADAGVDTAVSISDAVNLKGKATDAYGSIQSWAWDIGNTKVFTAASGGDTTFTAPAVPALQYLCILKVTDDDGTVDFDTVIVSVQQDPPAADAGHDTTVSIGDLIRLRGKGTDKYGSVASRAWDAGNTGTFRTAANGDTDIVAPTLAIAAYRSVFRVTDDDGQIAKDTLSVNVILDAPVVNAGKDTTVPVGQTISLAGTAAQQFGSMAMYYWDWQGNGIWDDSSSSTPNTSFALATGGTRSVIFAARDDDGNVAVDTVLVHAVSYVGGIVATSTTYTKSKSPYVLTSDLQVPAGVDLVLSAGVRISGAYKILVKGGSFTAVGISADSVIIGSQVKFEGSDLSASRISYANMSGAAEMLRVGDESEFSQAPVKNTGTLYVSEVRFTKTQVTTDGYNTTAKLLIRRMILDSSTLIGTYPNSEPIEIFSSSFLNSNIVSDAYNKGITIDSSSALKSTFKIGCCGGNFMVKNSSLTSSSFQEGDGSPVTGPLSFVGSSLTNTTVNLPYATVNIIHTTVAFPNSAPLVKLGHGIILRSDFTGRGSGTGLEITGYDGYNVGGAASVDSSSIKYFNIGIKVTNFGTLSMAGNNFVDNESYDLENLSPKAFSATGCYWSGALSPANIDTRIRDASDDLTFGKVTSTPWSNILVVH